MKVIDEIKRIVKDDDVYYNYDVSDILEEECSMIGGCTIGKYKKVRIHTDIKTYIGMERYGHIGVELIKGTFGWTAKRVCL